MATVVLLVQSMYDSSARFLGYSPSRECRANRTGLSTPLDLLGAMLLIAVDDDQDSIDHLGFRRHWNVLSNRSAR